MMSVLLLRSTQANSSPDKYQQVFSSASINIESTSPIGFEFFDLDKLYESIQKPGDFSGIIFSSPRTVQAVKLCIEQYSSLEEWSSSGLQVAWGRHPAFSVGTSTSSEAENVGFQTVGADCGNAENLVQVIFEKIQPNEPPLLFPCGTLRRDVIPKSLESRGVKFTPCIVYKTCPEPRLKENLEGYIKHHGRRPDAVVFFSPSGVQFSKMVLKELQIEPSSKCKFFAIGLTT
ncbi:putative uroporphyrinogen-III synthase [Apostichopus japonicus]|uniref:Uroporphyrinogen-III synthase n=1 Tax=Stichopus japonicus TaxID=307972 RepID=A0A2G8L4N5_STIJA|nr:putative uroporphyrinogen-III synthase [Apostichopus japonicus]